MAHCYAAYELFSCNHSDQLWGAFCLATAFKEKNF